MRRGRLSSAITWYGSSRSPGAMSPRRRASPDATARSSTASWNDIRWSRACSRPTPPAKNGLRHNLKEDFLKTLIAFLSGMFLAAGVAAQETKPDELVKKVTDDVMAAIKSDKQLAAGDKQKAL